MEGQFWLLTRITVISVYWLIAGCITHNCVYSLVRVIREEMRTVDRLYNLLLLLLLLLCCALHKKVKKTLLNFFKHSSFWHNIVNPAIRLLLSAICFNHFLSNLEMTSDSPVIDFWARMFLNGKITILCDC